MFLPSFVAREPRHHLSGFSFPASRSRSAISLNSFKTLISWSPPTVPTSSSVLLLREPNSRVRRLGSLSNAGILLAFALIFSSPFFGKHGGENGRNRVPPEGRRLDNEKVGIGEKKEHGEPGKPPERRFDSPCSLPPRVPLHPQGGIRTLLLFPLVLFGFAPHRFRPPPARQMTCHLAPPTE